MNGQSAEYSARQARQARQRDTMLAFNVIESCLHRNTHSISLSMAVQLSIQPFSVFEQVGAPDAHSPSLLGQAEP